MSLEYYPINREQESFSRKKTFKKNLLSLVSLLMIILILPPAVVISQDPQDVRLKAAEFVRGLAERSIPEQGSSLPRQAGVLVIEFYPSGSQNPKILDPKETGFELGNLGYLAIGDWQNRVSQMINKQLEFLREATRYHGYKDPGAPSYINYFVVNSYSFYTSIPRGFRLPNGAYRPHYNQILRNLNICDYVDNQSVKEVWMYGYHYTTIEPDESRMSSRYGDLANSWPKESQLPEEFRIPICNNSYVLYNFTYNQNASIADNVHNRMHQIENVVAYFDRDLFWKDFSEEVFNNTVHDYKSSCGNSHYAPNWRISDNDYDLDIRESRENNCETWHPDDSQTTYVNAGCSQWGCTDLGFYKWFMQNMPGYNNNIVFEGRAMRNWWDLMYDFNTSVEQERSLYTASSDSVDQLGSKKKSQAQKEIIEILVQGRSIYKKGQTDLNTVLNFTLPNVVAREATRTVPITIIYSESDKKTSVSRNIVFRYKLAGTIGTQEKALPGEECDPQRFSCFAMAERSDNNPEFLFCRNLGETTNNRYEWATQKFTTDICQGKEGITATCGDGQGGETKYWCTGETWVDETRWALIQKQKEEERQKQVQETQPSAIQTPAPQDSTSELSCSLRALPERINLGQKRDIVWIIEATNFKGVRAFWHGTNPGVQEISPVPVDGFNNTNYLSPSFTYNESQVGTYTRYVTIESENGRVCTTNTAGVTIESAGLIPDIQVGGPKTVLKIILTIPPYGQQKEISPGEKINFSLPDTEGVPQTIQVPISIIYSDGSTVSKTVSFAYKGTTPSGTTQTPPPTTAPTTPTSKNCVFLGYTCADSAGITADQTKKCDLESYRSDYTGCSQYYYCYTSCGPNQTPTLPQTGTPTVNCSGAGEFCADSGGSPKDPGTQCNTVNKAYRNNSAKDQWCQGGEPGWYCWLCQQ